MRFAKTSRVELTLTPPSGEHPVKFYVLDSGPGAYLRCELRRRPAASLRYVSDWTAEMVVDGVTYRFPARVVEWPTMPMAGDEVMLFRSGPATHSRDVQGTDSPKNLPKAPADPAAEPAK